MKTYNRICIKEHTMEDQRGTKFTLNRGQEYITSPVNNDGEVMVFSTYWVDVPVELFAGAVPGPGEKHK